MSDEIPEGWAAQPLPALVLLNPSKPPVDLVPASTPVSFVPMPAVDAALGTIQGATDRPFSEVRKGYTAFANDDVILAKITPCFENGKAAVARGLTNGMGFGSSEFFVLRSQGAVTPDYLFHFVRQQKFRDEGAAQMNGAVGQARVPADFLRSLRLPVPPLLEQHRIVEKVEALLQQVNRAKERLGRVPLILKRFRHSVLAAAYSGELTREFRMGVANVEDGPALLRRLMGRSERQRRYGDKLEVRQDLELPEIPIEWAWADLRFLSEPSEALCYGVVQPGEDVGDGVPLVRAGDLHDLVGAIPSLRRISKEIDSSYKRSRLRGGEVLITVVGANIGTVALAPLQVRHFNIARAVVKVPIREINAEYVLLWLRSAWAYRWMVGDAREVARPTLNIEQLETLPVPIPPLVEQTEVVRQTKALLSLAEVIEHRIERATGQAEKLPQAILSKAFSGELVSTEAELARLEGRTYETATELLKRVTALGSKAPPVPRKGRGGRPRKAE